MTDTTDAAPDTAPTPGEPGLRRVRRALWIAVAVGAVIAVLIAVLATRPPAAQRAVDSPLVGRPAPPLAAPTVDGGRVDIGDFAGRWVLVNYFATWCVPCRKEHPDLIRFHERHQDIGDLEVVGVVAFIHGLGASGRYWQNVRDASGGYHGIAVDLLGFGRSPTPRDAGYDVATHTGAIAGVVTAGSLVVGHSTGALLAAALLARHPDRTRQLLLLGMPAFPDPATARAEVGHLGLLARLTVGASPLARVLCEAMCRLRPLAIAAAPLVIRDLPPSIASDGARHSWPSYHRTLEHVVIDYRPIDDLAAAPAPVTFLHGTEDRTAPPELLRLLVEDLTARGTHTDLRLVPGDHHLAVRRPEQVAEILAHLLADSEAGP